MNKVNDGNIAVTYVPLSTLKSAQYNPRKHSKETIEQVKESIKRFGVVDPIVVNKAKGRENIVIGGHLRIKAVKELGHKEMPVVYVSISDLEKEKELNIRLNKNVGEWDLELLAKFDESFLDDIGFSSEELDNIFLEEENPEVFNLKKELEKLDIKEVTIKEGDVFDLGGSRLMCGDSTKSKHMNKLMDGVKADMVLTDPPYILDYLKGKKKTNNSKGFGYKRDRTYIGTETLPDNFTELWMKNVADVAKKDFHIIVYENWKNLRIIWAEMEKYWRVKNMLVWHLENRTQGFASKYKFFSKHDIAMVGSSDNAQDKHLEDEDELLQNEYETALYAISGSPHWESYGKGKKMCPTDFIEYKASDEKSSGQGIVFGTKPIEILIPYIKVLTKRNDLVLEPFGGSGSTLMAATKMNRRCYIMEKQPIYAEVIKKRWEKLTGLTAKKM